MPKRLDLVEQKFGRLTVIEYSGTNKRKESLWLCSCICGKEAIILGQSLVFGFTRSCGCYMKEKNHDNLLKDLSGQNFGRLIVKEYNGKNKWRESL